MDGSATLTMETSSSVMKPATRQTPSARQRRGSEGPVPGAPVAWCSVLSAMLRTLVRVRPVLLPGAPCAGRRALVGGGRRRSGVPCPIGGNGGT